MGINISQFNPPGTVSKLVWDEDMEPGTGKVFRGDLTGNVTGDVTGNVSGDLTGDVTGNVSGNVMGKTNYEWTMTPIAGDIQLQITAHNAMQIYQLSPGDILTGSIRCSINFVLAGVYLHCISSGWNSLLRTELSNTPTTYTLPEGTNGIYVENNQPDGALGVNISRFTIT